MLNPTFVVSTNFDFNDIDKKIIADAISISNVPAANITKTWNGSKLTIAFKSNLTANTSYSISMAKVNGSEGVGIIPFKTFTFKTIGNISLNVAADNNSLFDANNKLYKLKPVFVVTSSSAFNETDKTKIANAITVSNVDNSKLTKTWNGSSLTIGFKENLKEGTNYTLSMSSSSGINGLSVTPFNSLSFNTIGVINVNLESDDGNVISGNKFRLNPTFTVSPSYILSDANKTKIANAIRVTKVDTSTIVKKWKGNNLNISFSKNLDAGTDYSVSLSGFSGFEGATTKTFGSFSFKTFETINIAIADNENIIVDGRYKLNPKFVVTPNYAFSNSDREILKNSISISGDAANKITKTWNNDYSALTIEFSEKLTPNSQYTLSMASPSINGLSIKTFDNIVFTTVEKINPAIAAVDGSILTGNLYKLNPSFIVTPNISLDSKSRATFLSAISVSNVSEEKVSKTWSQDYSSLIIDFNETLAPNTSYTISMSTPNLDGIIINPFSNLSFTTIGTISFAIADYTDGGYKNVIAEYDK